MNIARKLALTGFLLHSAVVIAFLLRLSSVSDGEHQLGVWATLAYTFDAAWILPLGRLLPNVLNEWLFVVVTRLFPRPYELQGAIILISAPIGGAIYAAVGWCTGHYFDLRRSTKTNQPKSSLRVACLAPLALLIAVPLVRPLYEDIKRIDGFSPESAVLNCMQRNLSCSEARAAQFNLAEAHDPQFISGVRLYDVEEDGTVLARIGVSPHMRIAWNVGYYEKASSQPWAKPARRENVQQAGAGYQPQGVGSPDP